MFIKKSQRNPYGALQSTLLNGSMSEQYLVYFSSTGNAKLTLVMIFSKEENITTLVFYRYIVKYFVDNPLNWRTRQYTELAEYKKPMFR